MRSAALILPEIMILLVDMMMMLNLVNTFVPVMYHILYFCEREMLYFCVNIVLSENSCAKSARLSCLQL